MKISTNVTFDMLKNALKKDSFAMWIDSEFSPGDIVGSRGMPCECPLSNYVSNCFGLVHTGAVSVGTRTISVFNLVNGEISKTPVAFDCITENERWILAFINIFDRSTMPPTKEHAKELLDSIR